MNIEAAKKAEQEPAIASIHMIPHHIITVETGKLMVRDQNILTALMDTQIDAPSLITHPLENTPISKQEILWPSERYTMQLHRLSTLGNSDRVSFGIAPDGLYDNCHLCPKRGEPIEDYLEPEVFLTDVLLAFIQYQLKDCRENQDFWWVRERIRVPDRETTRTIEAQQLHIKTALLREAFTRLFCG